MLCGVREPQWKRETVRLLALPLSMVRKLYKRMFNFEMQADRSNVAEYVFSPNDVVFDVCRTETPSENIASLSIGKLLASVFTSDMPPRKRFSIEFNVAADLGT